MNHIAKIPLEAAPPIIVVEAKPGRAREAFLEQELSLLRHTRNWLLNCSLAECGSWAGVNTFFRSFLPELEEEAPHLIVHHDYELTMLMPELRSRIKVRNTSLTDDAMGDERVRNYPVDRAFRILHGLIDLLKSWRRNPDPWLLVCDNFTRAGALVTPFFLELARRGGPAIKTTIILVCDSGETDTVLEQVDQLDLAYHHLRPRLPASDQKPSRPDQATARVQARALMEKAQNSITEMEIHYPDLLRLWRAAEDERETFRAYVTALAFCNHNGFYHDGVFYADFVYKHMESHVADDEHRRWYYMGLLFHPYAVTGQASKAMEIYQEQGPKLTEPEVRARYCYSMSMLHARFLDDRNATLAEDFLIQGLSLLEMSHAEPETKYFLRVFLRNGLALVRIRQGRPEEAARLCSEGFAYLDKYLDPDRHRLHRSVLLYNTAQVYAQTDRHQLALEFYARALTMDPHYSEYHNERGNMLQQIGRYQEALEEYRQAIELSPPYHEVYFNMGICFQKLERPQEAFRAFTKALDLFPNQPHAYLNRAAILEASGQLKAAYEDYTRAIKWAQNPAEVYANRAVLLYQMNRLEEALADLNTAIERNPDRADFYLNRAVAHEELNHPEAAAKDLQTYLQLAPEAGDCREIQAKLDRLVA